MEYSIQEVARAAGTTSRTLRHYDHIGLLLPSRVGLNGYRYYDDRALLRLQRVLLLRELGLGLDAIGKVLAAQDARGAAAEGTQAQILASHLELLQAERERLDQQIASVERTIAAVTHTNKQKDGLMSQNIFEGFDHTQHREEVQRRWGAEAYNKSDSWWRGLGEAGQREWQQRVTELNADWVEAFGRGEDHASPAAQDLARRHVAWLADVPATPVRTGDADLAGYVLGLADMYVADERFAANYGGVGGATFVRDALREYVARHLA